MIQCSELPTLQSKFRIVSTTIPWNQQIVKAFRYKKVAEEKPPNSTPKITCAKPKAASMQKTDRDRESGWQGIFRKIVFRISKCE